MQRIPRLRKTKLKMKSNPYSSKRTPRNHRGAAHRTARVPRHQPATTGPIQGPRPEPAVFSCEPGPTGAADNPQALLAARVDRTILVYFGHQSVLLRHDVHTLLAESTSDLRPLSCLGVLGVRARFNTEAEAKAVWVRLLERTGYAV
jgi:hypothetical protein